MREKRYYGSRLFLSVFTIALPQSLRFIWFPEGSMGLQVMLAKIERKRKENHVDRLGERMAIITGLCVYDVSG